MYPGDPEATVVELKSVPQCETGAPCPRIFATEHRLILAYRMSDRSEDGSIRYAVIRFVRPRDYMSGVPNDEALSGHPLYKNGLSVYAFHQVLKSPWIQQLERMNSVHHRHSPESFRDLVHYIFTFHDSTFECVARSFEVQVADLAQMAEEFRSAFRSDQA